MNFIKLKILLFFVFITGTLNAQELTFVENKGQWKPTVQYKVEFGRGAMFLEKNCFTYNFINENDIKHNHGLSEHAHLPCCFDTTDTGHNHNEHHTNKAHFHAFKVHFLYSNPDVSLIPSKKEQDYHNYYLSKNSQNWITNVRKYRHIYYKKLYRNIDMTIEKKRGRLMYDFIVRRGGKISDIKLLYEGVDELRITRNGNLVVKTSLNEITELAPYAFQVIRKDTVEVKCNYTLIDSMVSFSIGRNYNPDYELIIDPELIFATYSGSTADNWGFTATYDSKGNVYSGGIASGIGYPVNIGAYQETYGGGTWDIAIIKYNPIGTQRLYATYIGGTSAEMPHSLVVNEFDELLLFGTTGSSNFPVTPNAYDTTFNGGTAVTYDYGSIRFENGTDIYVAKFSEDGTKLLSSTFIGGSKNDGFNFRQAYDVDPIIMQGNDTLYYNYGDGARGEIITDDQNNAYIATCTFSDDFPVSSSTFQTENRGREEGIVFKLDYSLSTLIWGAYIGGSGDDAVYSLDVGTNYDLYIAGGTTSPDLETTSTVFQTNYQGGNTDGFVAHISKNGKKLYALTYFGSGEYDQVYFVRTDRYNNVFIYGQTEAPDSTFIKNATYNQPNSGQFITKFPNKMDTIIWSTVFGTGNGRPNISPTAFAVDICGRVYLSGSGREWPIWRGWTYDATAGNYYYDFGWEYIDGTKGMEITPDAYQDTTDGQDFYIMVMNEDASGIDYATFFGEVFEGECIYDLIQVTCTGCYTGGKDHVDGGTSRFDKGGNIYHSICASCGGCQGIPVYPDSVWSSTNNSGNCNNAVFRISLLNDYAIADFYVKDFTLPGYDCVPLEVSFINQSIADSFIWDFGDGSPVAYEKDPVHIFNSPGIFDIKLIAVNPTSCNFADTLIRKFRVLPNPPDTLDPVHICYGDNAQIGLAPDNKLTYTWSPDTGLSSINVANPVASPDSTQEYMILISNGRCTDTVYQTVYVHFATFAANASPDTTVCSGDTITFRTFTNDTVKAYIWSYDALFTDTINENSTYSEITQILNKDTIIYVKALGKFCDNLALDTINVKVNPSPTPYAGKDTTVCKNKKILVGTCIVELNHNYLLTSSDTAFSYNHPCKRINIQVSNEYYLRETNEFNCTRFDTMKVTVNPLPVFNLGIDTTICQYDSLWIGADNGTNYLWNTGDTVSKIQINKPSIYSLTVTDKNNCQFYDSISVEKYDTLRILIDKKHLNCYQDNRGHIELNTNSTNLPLLFYFDRKLDSTGVYENLQADTFHVKLIDAKTCSDSTEIIITQPQKLSVKIIKENIKPCYGAKNGTITLTGQGGIPKYKYSFENQPFDSDSFFYNLLPKKYKIKLKDAHNCTLDTFAVITEPQELMIMPDIQNVLCDPVCNGSIDLNISGGIKPYVISWHHGNSREKLNSLCKGTYKVSIKDALNCQTEKEVAVKSDGYLPILDLISEKNTIYDGEKITIKATEGYDYYLWQPDSSLIIGNENYIVTAFPVDTTTYKLTIIDEIGCKNRDSVTINVEKVICDEPYIFIPNAFTPDNTENNNHILYVKSNMITQMTFLIYNRWGQKIFETQDINQGWDGTYKGKKQPPGVYVYYIKAQCHNLEIFERKGNITLIR